MKGLDGQHSTGEFQRHLANRLDDASERRVVGGWLAVRVGSRRLVIPLTHACEIFDWAALEPVAHVKPWFLGVANLRGTPCGVVDLAAWMTHYGGKALDDVLPRRSVADRRRARLIGLSHRLQSNTAVVIDELLGMRGVQSFVESNVDRAGVWPFLGAVYTEADGSLWQELNLQLLSEDHSFLNIAAAPDEVGAGAELRRAS